MLPLMIESSVLIAKYLSIGSGTKTFTAIVASFSVVLLLATNVTSYVPNHKFCFFLSRVSVEFVPPVKVQLGSPSPSFKVIEVGVKLAAFQVNDKVSGVLKIKFGFSQETLNFVSVGFDPQDDNPTPTPVARIVADEIPKKIFHPFDFFVVTDCGLNILYKYYIKINLIF
jgi:hypothetical protein